MTCNFAGDDCWKVRVHPKIDSISHNTGYTTGGQLLKIQGYGLNGTDVSVLVDGVECDVKETSLNSISCVTRATESDSFSGYQLGQPGLSRKIIHNTADLNNLNDEANFPSASVNLSTSFETLNFDSGEY
jgi:hypothetical protein